jgi:quercetin dioxygenase-like cupin family protein
MQVHRAIRDFVGDVRSTPKDNQGNIIPKTGSQPDFPPITRELMWEAKGKDRPLEVHVYSIAPGAEDSLHRHTEGIELMICWRGRGTMTIKTPSGELFQFKIERGDSVVVPTGAWHMVTALPEDKMEIANPQKPPPPTPAPGQPDNSVPEIAKQNLWAIEKLELVIIHAQGCTSEAPVENIDLLTNLQDLKRDNPADANALYRMMRPIGKFCGYARNPSLQCVRARIWGREAERDTEGAADDAKPTLHFTAYTFVPTQENPEHYHPHSVEFVMCLQGRAKMTVRPMIDPNDFSQGWERALDSAELNEGDAVLVPIGALHWYANASKEDCVLIALQSPHPILHILEDDAPVVAPA